MQMRSKIFPVFLPALLAMVLVAACAGPPEQEELPRQISSSTFHYPEDLWEAGVEGETTLRILVSPEGTVDSVRVQESSGYEQFDSAAVVGAHELRFEPGTRGEEPVPMWVLLPVQFDRPSGDDARPDEDDA